MWPGSDSRCLSCVSVTAATRRLILSCSPRESRASVLRCTSRREINQISEHTRSHCRSSRQPRLHTDTVYLSFVTMDTLKLIATSFKAEYKKTPVHLKVHDLSCLPRVLWYIFALLLCNVRFLSYKNQIQSIFLLTFTWCAHFSVAGLGLLPRLRGCDYSNPGMSRCVL